MDNVGGAGVRQPRNNYSIFPDAYGNIEDRTHKSTRDLIEHAVGIGPCATPSGYDWFAGFFGGSDWHAAQGAGTTLL
jgi:hypothetical protein